MNTSIHCLNADRNLNWPNKFAYILLNFFNNAFPNWLVDKNLVQENYLTKGNLDHLGERSTLSRKLSNLFWREFDWKELKNKYKTINIFDLGCGAGDITERLYTDYAKGMIDSYKGVDVFPHLDRWQVLKTKYNGLEFSKINNEKEILKDIPIKTNMIISQSSLEHIENDLVVFKQIRKFVDLAKHEVIQIHLVPSASCLWLYLFHGVRQYTPRTISKISKLFDDSFCKLVGFGGNESFKLQWNVFTKQEIFNRLGLYKFGFVSKEWQGSNFNKIIDKKSVIDKYEKLARQAIRKDMKDQSKRAVFYALIIKSNFNEK